MKKHLVLTGPSGIGKTTIIRQALGTAAVDGETSALYVVSSILKLRAASLALITENYATDQRMDAPSDEALFRTAAEALLCE